MLRDVVAVQPRGSYRLWLRFDDGVEGEVDLAPELTFSGVFAPLKDPSYFASVGIDPELGTICWANGADWDTMSLYSHITAQAIDVLLAAPDTART